MTTPVSMTNTNKKANSKASKEFELLQIPYMHYLALFHEFSIEAVMDSGSGINAMHPSFVRILDLCIYKNGIDAQMMKNNKMKTYKIVLTSL